MWEPLSFTWRHMVGLFAASTAAAMGNAAGETMPFTQFYGTYSYPLPVVVPNGRSDHAKGILASPAQVSAGELCSSLFSTSSSVLA